jgi:hypothetical protein
MSRRVCTSQPGYGACCQAAQAGQLNTPIVVNVPGHGQRCGICRPHQKRNGSQGFQFRFQKSATCGLAAGGCPIGQQGTQIAASPLFR